MSMPCPDICTPWATEADVGSPCDDYEFDPTVLDDGLQVASQILYELTGRRWPGVCTETIRPCGYRTTDAWGAAGQGWCGCLSSRTCGCRQLSELRLPNHPAIEVTAVKIDGATVDFDRYRIDDYRWLVYLPESDTAERQSWPCCQRIDLPDTDEDTWSVTYTYGQEPPLGGVKAAASLGCQLALGWQPETVGQCRLPKRVTTVTRQGITLGVIDPLSLFADGLTGLPEVDLWVQSIRLGQQRRQAAVMVPGARRVGYRKITAT